jgi:primosomal protein N' (replication factor Y)
MDPEPTIPDVSSPPRAVYADVAVPVPLRRTFTYTVPESLASSIVVGSQVEVPLGPRTSPGFVVELGTRAPDVGEGSLRAIAKVTYPEPVFDAEILGLARRVADYYLASLGEVLMTALPGGLRAEALRARPVREDPTIGLAKIAERLTPAQRAVRRRLDAATRAGAFGVFLLHGVTGSGKTEVYTRIAEDVVARGGQVLVLVPEIALSFQVVERLRLAFGERVGVIHSRMTRRARQDTWRAARAGELSVVVGARSAVFTPLPSLGVVIIDEEHDGAYKQSDAPRYHAREVAIFRAEMRGIPILLGSATPSLETYANAVRGKFELLRLPERIDSRPTPSVRFEDLRVVDDAERGPVIISDRLAREIDARLTRREQTILFLNRRGYAPFVQCRECGESLRCSQCDVSLTYHRTDGSVICHYCGERRERVRACAACGSTRIFFGGVGTQKVEEELEALFPEARVLRLDFDATRRVGSHQKILRAFGRHEGDILLGTQMVAKGLDFPRVSLVGVINADAGLNMPDFRSAERSFQILTQVAGRAGRADLAGEVIFQTYYPEHYTLVTAGRQDYVAFFRREMEARGEVGYPPFSRMTNVLFDGAREERVVDAAERVADTLIETAPGGVRVLGPAPQPLSRLKGKHRWHLALRSPRYVALRAACEETLSIWDRVRREIRGVRLTLDVDPIDLL